MAEAGQDDDRPPWEQPGAVRRDVAPHRGHWLLWLSYGVRVLGLVSFAFPPVGVLVLLLVGVLSRVAERDLDHMTRGTMDPRGRQEATAAMLNANRGASWVMVSWVVWLLLSIGSVLLSR